jgi:CheY-like chemotaxis protein/signal transduction histidine kinase
MNSTSFSIDADSFRRILTRNVALPLGVGVLGVVLFVGLIGYLLYVLNWVEHTDQVIARSNESLRQSVDCESSLRGFLLSGDEEYLEGYLETAPRLLAGLQALRELTSDNAVQSERMARIEASQVRWLKMTEPLIEARRANQDVSAFIREKQGKRLMDEVRQGFVAAIATEEQLRHERSERANRAVMLIIGLLVLMQLGGSGTLAIFGRRELIGLSSNYDRILEQQARFTEQLQAQAWLREGQSLLAEQLIGQQTPALIGRAVLDFLAGYLEVAVGALYVREGEGRLRRVADYGFAPGQQAREQVFEDGASLLGQVLRSREARVMEGLPPSYLRVNSGLGDTDPLTVILSPTRSDGQVNGVIELAFLRPLSPRDRQLLEAVAESLGTSIEAARYRQRLHDMLTETQQLNEELQVQQEELRVANEELEDQARVIRDSQANLETQQAELEQTNEQLSEKTRRLEDQRDLLDERNHALDQARRELESRAEELQRASRYKSEFLANMSHELRTPLNSSLILSKLLAENRKGNLDPQQVHYAELINKSGNELLRLISDILDISKVEAGRLEVHPEDTDVAQLVDGLRALFQPQADDKGLAFDVQVEPDAPARLYTDGQRAGQILRNLLSNAVKFTASGRIGLKVRAASGGIAFEVSDSGIGISDEQMGIIFEPFRQVDGTTNRRFGGTGLGLSISRNLAEMLGGSITVQSQPGRGSCFTLWLPGNCLAGEPLPPIAQVQPAEGVRAVAPAASASGLQDDRQRPVDARHCVLVIENDPKFARDLYELAHELGHRCLVAGNAEEGLRLAREQGPDAVLLDMRLPDESGLAVLQTLKEDPVTRHLPVHVLSIDDRTGPALQLGAIGHARKPITREQLREVFARLEEKLTQKVKHVLVVEGDASQRDSIAQLVSDEDIQVSAVASGAEALERLRGGTFDCMIIDLALPDMRGNELLERMAAEALGNFPPVIVYTARQLSPREEEELLRHSRSIIIKGACSPERLLDEVTLFLHKVESSLSSDRQRMLQSARNRDRVFEERTVLVVDDDVRNIFALISALDEKGAQVVTARNGQEALQKLEENPQIDLVLMDVMMPVMDGLEATRRIRKDPRWSRLPIIAVTAKAMKDDQEQCLGAGASDYLAKPIDLERLFSLIRVWLPKWQRY